MLSEWSQFAERYWIFGGILMSLLWFMAGRQSVSNRQLGYALFWLCVAALIATVLCVWAVLEREWIGLGVGIFVLGIEMVSIRRTYTARSGQQ